MDNMELVLRGIWSLIAGAALAFVGGVIYTLVDLQTGDRSGPEPTTAHVVERVGRLVDQCGYATTRTACTIAAEPGHFVCAFEAEAGPRLVNCVDRNETVSCSIVRNP